MKKRLAAIIVIILLAFIAYVETPTAKINEDYVYFYGETAESETASTSADVYGAPELEYKLEDTKVENGFVIETYREYEIYKNREGEVVKNVPTSNREYLKYKQ